jgi:hypothetical protein
VTGPEAGPAAAPSYVTVEQLAAILQPASTQPILTERIQVAVDAANALIAQWTPQDDTGTPAPVGPITTQAGLELAQTLYRRHAATGGIVDLDALVARLPSDLVRSIRDELDAQTAVWGLA